MYLCMYVCMYVCMLRMGSKIICMYVCVSVCMCVCMYGAVYHEKLRERVLVPGEHLRHFAGHLVRSRRSFEVIGDVAACQKCMYVCMYYVKKM